MTTIPAILQENARRWPERDALIATNRNGDQRVSFAELEKASLQFSGSLAGKGIKPGDHVLVFVPMSIELYVTLLGLFRLGAVAVFLDPSAGIKHINNCCAMLPPAALVSVWPLRLLKPFVKGLRRIPQSFAPPRMRSTNANPLLPPLPSADDAALITFTSGSTGAPKAAVRTHRFLIAQHRVLQSSIALESGEQDLTTLPVFVLANLASGVTSILPDAKISRPGSVDAKKIARQAARLRPTRTGGSPAFYQRLATAPEALATLRKIYTGGAPVFPSLLQHLQTLAPQAEVVAVYGSTEAEPIAHIACREITDEDWASMRGGRGLLAGSPVPEVRLRIIKDQWGQKPDSLSPLDSGQTGEILVTGDHVLKGYLHGRGDEETKVPLDGEIWHRTGDAGYLDDHGRLWLMGRCSASIRDQRGVLYPFAVECVAMTYAAIQRAAFVRDGEKRLLALELAGQWSAEEMGTLKEQLRWAGVDKIRVLPRIPVDARHNAKVNYPELAKLLKRQS
jgi:acyl-CoA synthetase (AMP-forming)/AMP-acid ligase II